MFDNITRHFSLKGDDRIAIGNSIGEIENIDETPEDTPVELNEKDIDTIEIDDHAILDDLIEADAAESVDDEEPYAEADETDEVIQIDDPNVDSEAKPATSDVPVADEAVEDTLIVSDTDPIDEIVDNYENGKEGDEEDITVI